MAETYLMLWPSFQQVQFAVRSTTGVLAGELDEDFAAEQMDGSPYCGAPEEEVIVALGTAAGMVNEPGGGMAAAITFRPLIRRVEVDVV